jgi:hypothetical protein
VVTPFALGWGVGAVLLPEHSGYAHAFLGATLTATSVGITARVLGDIGKSRSPEARVILGAAVIDDVLGLVILAIVGGAIMAADQGAKRPGAIPRGPQALVFLGGPWHSAPPSPALFHLPRDCGPGRPAHNGAGVLFRPFVPGSRDRLGPDRRRVRRRPHPGGSALADFPRAGSTVWRS